MPTWNDPERDEAAEALKARFAKSRKRAGPSNIEAPRMTRSQWWIAVGVVALVVVALTLT